MTVAQIQVGLGIDLGTSSVKVCLMDADGELVAASDHTYPLRSDQPGWVQTRPEDWMSAIDLGVRDVLAAQPRAQVCGIGIDGQMHGLVLVDGTEAVRPALLWPDTRAWDQVSRWAALPGHLRAALANPLAPGMFGPMLAWLTEHEPDAVARARAAVSPKDWVRMQLTPRLVTDASDASATLLWDVTGSGWHTELAQAVGIPTRLLVPVAPGDEVAGPLDAAVATRWGLPAGLPVSVGAGDAASTVLATGWSDISITVGTGIQVIRPGLVPQAVQTPRYHTFATADRVGQSPGYYAMIAPMNGGLAQRRVLALLDADWDELYGSLTATGSPAMHETVFLPYFSAERLPRSLPGGLAGWSGLGMDAERGVLLRACLEATAFLVRQGVEALGGVGRVPYRLVGGGTRDPRFQQLLADVLAHPVQGCLTSNLTALGSARLGWRVAGRDVAPGVRFEPVVEPNPDSLLDHRFDLFTERSSSLVVPS